MKLKYRCSLCGIALLASASIAHADDLMQVYHQAVKSDPTFKQAESNWMAERENVPIAYSAVLPQLGLQGQFFENYRNTKPFTFLNTDGFFNGYEYQVNLKQSVFDYGAWKAISGAKAQVKAATATYLAAAQTLMVNVATAYFAVLQAYDKLRFTLANKRAVYRELVTARQQFKVGLIAITGVYDAQSSYDQAIADEISDRNTLENKLEDLRAITGVYYPSLAGLGRRLPLLIPIPNNINAWVVTADRQNYSLRAQEFTVQSAREKVKETAAGRYPTLSLIGQYDDRNSFNHKQIPSNIRIEEAKVGGEINFPIFQGGLVFAETKQARYDYVTASGQLEFEHRSVVNSTRQSFLGVVSGISQVKADRQRIKSAKNALAATQAGYAVGTRTMVDVLNDLSTLYDAQQQYADDQYAYILSTIDLKEAAGTLSATDLELINKWLKKHIRFPVSKASSGKPVLHYPKRTYLGANKNNNGKNTPPPVVAAKAKSMAQKNNKKSVAVITKSAPEYHATAAKALQKRFYTIQLFSSNIKLDALRYAQSIASPEIAVVKMKGLYKVIYSQYSNGSKAELALKGIPAQFRHQHAWVLSVPASTPIVYRPNPLPQAQSAVQPMTIKPIVIKSPMVVQPAVTQPAIQVVPLHPKRQAALQLPGPSKT